MFGENSNKYAEIHLVRGINELTNTKDMEQAFTAVKKAVRIQSNR